MSNIEFKANDLHFIVSICKTTFTDQPPEQRAIMFDSEHGHSLHGLFGTPMMPGFLVEMDLCGVRDPSMAIGEWIRSNTSLKPGNSVIEMLPTQEELQVSQHDYCVEHEGKYWPVHNQEMRAETIICFSFAYQYLGLSPVSHPDGRNVHVHMLINNGDMFIEQVPNILKEFGDKQPVTSSVVYAASTVRCGPNARETQFGASICNLIADAMDNLPKDCPWEARIDNREERLKIHRHEKLSKAIKAIGLNVFIRDLIMGTSGQALSEIKDPQAYLALMEKKFEDITMTDIVNLYAVCGWDLGATHKTLAPREDSANK